MAANKTGVFVGVAIAVIGVAALLYFSQSQPAVEDATGAIGAAERYRAEQISDEDVILDLPGQQEFAEAVFANMTDEQKAELVGRVDAAARQQAIGRVAEVAAQSGSLEARTMAGLVRALPAESRAELASKMRLSSKDRLGLSDDALGRMVDNLGAQTVLDAGFGRFEMSDASWASMSNLQKAALARSGVIGSREQLANSLQFSAAELASFSDDLLGRAILEAEVFERQDLESQFALDRARFAGLSASQKHNFLGALDDASLNSMADDLGIDGADLKRMDELAAADALGRASDTALQAAIDDFNSGAKLSRTWDAERASSYFRSMPTGAQETLAAHVSLGAEALLGINDAALAGAVDRLDRSALAAAATEFGAVESEMFNSMSLQAKAQLFRASGLGVQENLAGKMKLGAEDVLAMNDDVLAKAVDGLEASARMEAFDGLEISDSYFEAMDTLGKAAVADAMGSKALERQIVVSRAYSGMRTEQMARVWDTLGREGQLAALSNLGLTADLGSADYLQRQEELARFSEGLGRSGTVN